MARTAKTAETNPTTDTPATLTTAEKIAALPGATFSGVASAALNEAAEFHRWQHRMSRADVVKEALAEWADKRDLMPGAIERLTEQVENDETAE